MGFLDGHGWTSKFNVLMYYLRLKWVGKVVETDDSDRQIAILRLYRMSALGKSIPVGNRWIAQFSAKKIKRP
ncbi:hypothetical protein QFZ23_003006 [Arthrobacter globiformis]|nr:hypothetical protein [Arthrobacter globiformis]